MRIKQLKPNDVIDVKEEHKKILEGFMDRESGIKSGLTFLSEALKQANNQTWKMINALYPETKGFICNLDSKEMKIKVLYKKRGRGE
jgi:hypothetical protein